MRLLVYNRVVWLRFKNRHIYFVNIPLIEKYENTILVNSVVWLRFENRHIYFLNTPLVEN